MRAVDLDAHKAWRAQGGRVQGSGLGRASKKTHISEVTREDCWRSWAQGLGFSIRRRSSQWSAQWSDQRERRFPSQNTDCTPKHSVCRAFLQPPFPAVVHRWPRGGTPRAVPRATRHRRRDSVRVHMSGSGFRHTPASSALRAACTISAFTVAMSSFVIALGTL